MTLVAFLTACAVFERPVGNSRQPQPIFIASSECSLPCAFGITAGETTYADALAMIASLPSEQIESTSAFWVQREGETRIHITVRRTFPDPRDLVRRIELSTYSEGQIISLGDMIDAGYTPTRVYRNRVQGPNVVNLLIAFGEDRDIFATVSAIGDVNANSPIDTLIVTAPQYSEQFLVDLREIRNYDYEIAWQGYATVDEYVYADTIVPTD